MCNPLLCFPDYQPQSCQILFLFAQSAASLSSHTLSLPTLPFRAHPRFSGTHLPRAASCPRSGWRFSGRHRSSSAQGAEAPLQPRHIPQQSRQLLLGDLDFWGARMAESWYLSDKTKQVRTMGAHIIIKTGERNQGDACSKPGLKDWGLIHTGVRNGFSYSVGFPQRIGTNVGRPNLIFKGVALNSREVHRKTGGVGKCLAKGGSKCCVPFLAPSASKHPAEAMRSDPGQPMLSKSQKPVISKPRWQQRKQKRNASDIGKC